MGGLVTVEITGNALVKIKRKVKVSPKQAKFLLSSDEAMMAVLSKNKDFEIQDWGVVYGQRSHCNWVENLNIKIGV